MRTPASLKQLLHDDICGELSRLRARCGQLNQLDRRVRKLLPEALRPHCRVANLQGEQLLLLAESPAWHALLRYQLPALQQALAREGDLPTIRRIHLRVQPPQASPGERGPVAPLRMAPRTAALIADLARGVEDPALRAILMRLSRRGTAETLSPPPGSAPDGPRRHPPRR